MQSMLVQKCQHETGSEKIQNEYRSDDNGAINRATGMGKAVKQ